MGIWGVVGTAAAVWLALSIVVAGAYGLIGWVTRTDADRLREELADLMAVLSATPGRAEDELSMLKVRWEHVCAEEARANVAEVIAEAERYLGQVR